MWPWRPSAAARPTRKIAADKAVHPFQVNLRKKQLLEGASDLFLRGKQTQDKEDQQPRESERFQDIGILKEALQNPSAAPVGT